MYLKWLGSAFIIAGCAGTGFSMAAAHRKECRSLRQLIGTLDYMACELQYRMSPLPDLCRGAALQTDGGIKKLLIKMADELERRSSSNAAGCMQKALEEVTYLPPITAKMLRELGNSLGVFDLSGQLTSLESVRQNCRNELSLLTDNQEARLRSYKILGVCAGAALAILLI